MFFFSIRTQTDDSSCSCNSFKGMVSYRKLIIQDVQIYQTHNVWVPKTCDAQIVKCYELVHIQKISFKVSKFENEEEKEKRDKSLGNKS